LPRKNSQLTMGMFSSAVIWWPQCGQAVHDHVQEAADQQAEQKGGERGGERCRGGEEQEIR
jgi:hypothetical protein